MQPRYRRAWIWKRKDAQRMPYQVSWIDAGRRYYRSFPTQALARAAKAQIERELNTWLESGDPLSWHQLITAYGAHLATMSPRHQQSVSATLERFYSVAEPVDATELTTAAFEAYFAERASAKRERKHPEDPDTPLSSATLRREWIELRAFTRFLVESHYLRDDPMRTVAKPRLPRRIRAGVSDSAWLKLLEACLNPDSRLDDPQAWHLLILLALVTGVRQSVLLSTRISDIQLGDGDSAGVALIKYFSSKTAKESLHGIPAVVADRIAIRVSELPPGSKRLFPWLRWQRAAWGRLQRVAGVSFEMKSLRAASGTRAAVARARQAGAAALDHSSAAVFHEHYEDLRQTAIAVATTYQLPPLPRMPRLGELAYTPKNRKRPQGSE